MKGNMFNKLLFFEADNFTVISEIMFVISSKSGTASQDEQIIFFTDAARSMLSILPYRCNLVHYK